MFGLFDASKKEKVLWVLASFGAALYQIWWDVFMDWELGIARAFAQSIISTSFFTVVQIANHLLDHFWRQLCASIRLDSRRNWDEELCLWATAFAAMGCVAAAHRSTM
jgi:hypothetical protein